MFRVSGLVGLRETLKNEEAQRERERERERARERHFCGFQTGNPAISADRVQSFDARLASYAIGFAGTSLQLLNLLLPLLLVLFLLLLLPQQ
jgi:hypothetical protein